MTPKPRRAPPRPDLHPALQIVGDRPEVLNARHLALIRWLERERAFSEVGHHLAERGEVH